MLFCNLEANLLSILINAYKCLRFTRGKMERLIYYARHLLNRQTEFIRVMLNKEWDLLPEVSLWEAINIENKLIQNN